MPGEENPADMFTKARTGSGFNNLRDISMGVSLGLHVSDEMRRILHDGVNRYTYGAAGRPPDQQDPVLERIPESRGEM